MKTVLLLILFAVAGWAADISGTWKGVAPTPMGPSERTFVFKVEGAKVTGETSSALLGKSVIEDGKVDGDALTFRAKGKLGGEDMELKFRGKISGNEIRFHVDSTDGSVNIDYTVKKIS